jgi:hypothetical protein
VVQSLTRAANEIEFVVPGLVPGIHVFVAT